MKLGLLMMPGNVVSPDSSKKITITHVKMQHSPVALDWWTYQLSGQNNKQFESENCEEEIAASQFAVAQYILTHPEHIVVHEGLSELWSSEQIDLENETTQRIRRNFSKGTFNKSFDELSPEQKNLLREKHGAPLLLYLGLIDVLYPSASLETSQTLAQEIRALNGNYRTLPDIEQRFRMQREKEAIIFSKSAADNTGVTKILLVYGGIHHFEHALDSVQDSTLVLAEPVDLCQVFIPNTAEPLHTNLAVNEFNLWSSSTKKAFTSDVHSLLESNEHDDENNNKLT